MSGTYSRQGSDASDASDASEDDKKQSSAEAVDAFSTNETSSSPTPLVDSLLTSSSGKAKLKMTLTDLPDDLLKYSIGDYLTLQECQNLSRVNRFFNQKIGEDRSLNARLACYHVLTGQPNELRKLLVKDPDLFFHQVPEVTFGAAGQVYYKVSPADLVYFLCDDDMWIKVKAFAINLPEDKCMPFFVKWQKQQQAMGQGGADLLYVAGDTPPQYEKCFETTETFNIHAKNYTLTRTLLKNPDGIVCWKDGNNQVNLYYVNPATKVLEPIDISETLSETEKSAVDAFKADMIKMEPNTVRRSNNAEHGLFKDVFSHNQTHQPIELIRAGIHYKQDGIDTIDTHHDFNRLTNAYLKCIRLYKAVHSAWNPEREKTLIIEGDSVWRAELGRIQKEVIWLLQRFCESNRRFSHLPNNFNSSPFRRGFLIHYWQTREFEWLFDVTTGEFSKDFGVDSDSGFAIRKGGYQAERYNSMGEAGQFECDLIAQNRLNLDATNAVEIPIELPAPVAGPKLGR